MSGAAGLYRINNFDVFASFGFAVASGKDGFMNYPTTKEPFSYDWADGNGKDYDLSQLYFQDMEVKLSGTIMADTPVIYWANYYAFWAILKSGQITIYNKAINRNFNCFYKSSTFSSVTPFIDNQPVAVKVELVFQNLTSFLANDVPNYPDDFMITKTVATYAAMLAAGVPRLTTRYKITTDETNDNQPGIYEYYPDGVIMWIAAIDKNNQN